MGETVYEEGKFALAAKHGSSGAELGASDSSVRFHEGEKVVVDECSGFMY